MDLFGNGEELIYGGILFTLSPSVEWHPRDKSLSELKNVTH